MTMKKTYRIARVCLTTGTVSCLIPDDAWVNAYLGGRGLGLRLMQESDDPNPLLFVTGPMTDSSFPASGRFCAVTRSPITGKPIYPSSGSAWGVALKRTGWDGILLEGSSPEWISVHIGSNNICISDAKAAIGMRAGDTERWQKEVIGQNCSVLCIGPAGENRVPISAILCGTRRAFGRDGIGAVMGAKRIKSIAVCTEGIIDHSCSHCNVHCGHTEAATESPLCNDYGLDAISFSRVISAARDLRRMGCTDIPDWDDAEWAAKISSPFSELTHLAGCGAEALCKTYCSTESINVLQASKKTARSGIQNKLTKEMAAVLDAMGCCLFSAILFGPKEYADWLSSATGTDVTEAGLLQIGKNICNLEASLLHANAGK